MKFSSPLSCVCFIVLVSTVGSSAELTQHNLRSAVTMASQDVLTSAHGTTVSSVIPRILKAKGTATKPKGPKVKKTKAPKSTKKPKAPKSAKKPKSNKTSVTVSPSPQPTTAKKLTSQPSVKLTSQPSVKLTSQPSLSSQPSSPPTVAKCTDNISDQKDALLALKAGFTNGGTILTDWVSGTDPCTGDSSNWGDAIICDSGLVTGIDLFCYDAGTLTGTINPLSGFENLSCLTYLDFYYHGLSGTIPTELAQLTRLTYLSFAGNSLTGTIPTELGNLASLTDLDFYDITNLSGTIPTELGKLTSLESLYLNYNNLSGTIPTELGQVTTMSKLQLGYNKLTGTIPTELGQLTGSTDVQFLETSLTGTMPTEICALRKTAGGLISYLTADYCGSPPEVTCNCCTNTCP